MKKNESKYFNTAILMDEALLSILAKKPIEFITVKEICEKAGVNRSTFYLHYETIDDLLFETAEFANQKFLSYFRKDSKKFIENINTCPLEELIFITSEYVVPYLNYVKENRHIFCAAFKNQTAMKSDFKFDAMYKHIFEPILIRFSCNTSERNYILKFYLSGIISVIQEWLNKDCVESVEFISDIIIKCVSPMRYMNFLGGDEIAKPN